MLDPLFFRQNPEKLAEKLKERNYDFDIEYFQSLESSRRQLQEQTESLQSERNSVSKQIGLSKSAGEDVSEIMNRVSGLGDRIKVRQSELSDIQQQLHDLLSSIPNIAHESVPLGYDENDNVEIRRWGEARQFDFEIKDHVSLGEHLGMLDFDTASHLSGSRFVVIRGQLSRLHRALAQFMLDLHGQQHDYEEVNVPVLVNSETLYGTGQLPKFENDQFSTQDDPPYYLIPTAEVPLTNTVGNQITESDKLPIRFIAHTPCFRREAGSYGRDTRGMIRQHQFEKVEMVQIVRPDTSYQALEEMIGHAEAILQNLDLSYRVVALCTGDMGFSAAKTYDLDVWIPSQNKFREISSCSNTENFQARRMKARWRNPETGKTELVHTLNGSGVAIGRAMVAVMENYQNADSSITVPEVLRPYMGGLSLIK